MMIIVIAFTDRFNTNQWFQGSCKLSNYFNGETEVKVNNVQISDTQIGQYIGKDLITFRFMLSRAPVSIRYRNTDTNPVILSVNSPKIGTGSNIPPLVIGGITQTIWGGAATPYMTAKPATGDATPVSNATSTTISWDFSKKPLAAQKIVGFNADSQQFKRSIAFTLNSYNDDAPERIWSKSPITPPQVAKYWPWFGNQQLGAKAGELVVLALALPAPNLYQTASSTGTMDMVGFAAYLSTTYSANIDNVVLTTLSNEMTIKQVKPAFTCTFNVFITYDIYWNVWAVAVSSTLMIVATAIIIPTKCIDVKGRMQRKKVLLAVDREHEPTVTDLVTSGDIDTVVEEK
ncbi:hypothetical protein SS50377_21885 [Spironucleus salmonicida]|uniref:Uncharacterized protein n=1 Tax=Spironucleus salmonicida TaxID=348837 RepID=V6LIP7_9EUKA|nr:hypothetical protein SS50377_21885 [Spironucleus salmonicida]|eukprot:EST44427.1 Hypothetical protein SS50377_15733 [Spironucleus salmonicida]